MASHDVDDRVALPDELDRHLDMLTQSVKRELRVMLCGAFLAGKAEGIGVAERAIDRAFAFADDDQE